MNDRPYDSILWQTPLVYLIAMLVLDLHLIDDAETISPIEVQI